MKRWQWVSIGLASYAISLMVTAPAILLEPALRNLGYPHLRLLAAQGTVWSGSATLEVLGSDERSGLSKALAWQVLPQSLLLGQLRVMVTIDSSQTFPLTLTYSGWALEQAELRLPAGIIGLNVERLAPLGLTGDLFVHITNLSFKQRQLRGNATVQWRHAGSVLTPISPLGDYQFDWHRRDTRTQIALRTVQGELQLEGQGSWAAGESADFLVLAQVPPQLQPQLAPLLRLIALEREAGVFELQLR